jgi:hypothetical protein
MTEPTRTQADGPARAGERLAAIAFARLELPDVRTVPGIVERVAALRGRPITITELPSLAGTRTCGWWNARAHRDEILIAPAASRPHRDALVLHELGHIVLDHFGLAPQPAFGPARWDERPATTDAPRAMRSHFHDANEVAAELLADAFARAVRRGPRGLGPFLRVFT